MVDYTYLKSTLQSIKSTLSKKKEELKKEKTEDHERIDFIKLYNELKEAIVGQDEVLKNIITTIDRNMNIGNYRHKTNMMIVGSKNTGKTEIFKVIKDKTDIPVVIVDCTNYIESGFNNEDISQIVCELIVIANCDMDKANKGIIVLDNFDKLLDEYKEEAYISVINSSILSFIKGKQYNVDLEFANLTESVSFDTSTLTFVLIGNFDKALKTDNLYSYVSKSQKRIDDLTEEDFVKYGIAEDILEELAIYKLKNLTEEDLYNIMLKSVNSVLYDYYLYAKQKKVKIEMDETALRKIAKLAYNKHIGADGIKAILDELLQGAFTNIILNNEEYSIIQISEHTIDEEPPYRLIKKIK